MTTPTPSENKKRKGKCLTAQDRKELGEGEEVAAAAASTNPRQRMVVANCNATNSQIQSGT